MVLRTGSAVLALIGLGGCSERVLMSDAPSKAIEAKAAMVYAVETDSSLYTLNKQSFPDGDLYRVRIQLTVRNSGSDTLFLTRDCKNATPVFELARTHGDSTWLSFNIRDCIHDDPGPPLAVPGSSALLVDLNLAVPVISASSRPFRIEELTGEFVPVLDAYVRGDKGSEKIMVPAAAVDTFRIVPPSQ